MEHGYAQYGNVQVLDREYSRDLTVIAQTVEGIT